MGAAHAKASARPAAVPPTMQRSLKKDGMAVLGEVLSAAIATGALVWALKISLSYMDPYREQRREAKRQSAILRARLGRNIELNEFEMLLASNVLNPDVIDVALDDIGGLEGVKDEMRLKVLRPLREPGTFCTTLWRPVKGVLFYGPPGTGKTMLAKALAAESHCFFINVTASAIMSKWYGDANRLIRAIFTLAAKLEPAVIFIDEVDAFLTRRGSSSEHEATLQAKTEFMQLWDGMEGARAPRVLVMGATNRPWMVDEAVLRRFALQYEVGLPTASERAAILRRYLARHAADMEALAAAGRLAPGEGGVEPELLAPPARGGGLSRVVAATEGYSGSDLMELAAQAAQNVLVQHWAAGGSGQLRPLAASDLLDAAGAVRPSVSKAAEYSSGRHGSARFDAGGGEAGGLAQAMAAMAAVAAAAGLPAGGSRAAGKNNGGAAAGSSGSSSGSSEAAEEAGAPPAAADDELCKLIGKMVLSSMPQR